MKHTTFIFVTEKLQLMLYKAEFTNIFGVAVSARISGLVSLLPVARIDQVRMRVHYMVSMALDETIFTVTKK